MTRAAVLAIDQGTTSSRALVFDAAGAVVCQAQHELPQLYPAEGWVEHDPEAIWSTTVAVVREALQAAQVAGHEVTAIGITNQRETALLWERRTGAPICNAIVWQDRRTADQCARLASEGVESEVTARTGLLLDPYFSATKIAWMLDNISGARRRAEAGDLAFGTVDTYLLWRLTGGKAHLTDATNASRTLLFDIHRGAWSEELARLFRVPAGLLPEVRDCAATFGSTDPALFGRAIPILGVAGDQQAAAIGQHCFSAGEIKSTYGTGCFVLVNTGERVVQSRNRLLSTIAYRMGGRTTYALEGSIFSAGSTVQWLRDELRVITHAAQTESLARSAGASGVYLVPAFTGLGAPHWDPDARGAILGLTRGSGIAALARAALESVCYQTHDLLEAMRRDGIEPTRLRVDGGMIANDWLMQCLADIVHLPVDRPLVAETTALGAAYLAGQGTGVFGSFEELAAQPRSLETLEPSMPAAERDALLAGWNAAVRRVLSDR
ncbi:MAG TPA: glycerol kinase GlpK [Steroidobacteraceae bacterium]|nr:glycerol kinase GlpK [Steroidobacteraceae bacterium]